MPARNPKKRRFTANELLGGAAVSLSAAAALFCLVVSTLLVANFIQMKAVSPLDNPQIAKLRAQLATAPETDPKLVQQIEAMDLLARKAFFTSQAHIRTGGYLLLGGAVVLLVALRAAATSRRRAPVPEGAEAPAAYWATRNRAKKLVAITGATWIALALVAAFFTRLDIPQPAATGAASAKPESEAAKPQYPNWETMRQNWPSFRGPGGYGVAHFATAPTEWDVPGSKNIKWKVEVPLPGANSPIVWDKHVYLSGATDATREVFCFDADTGQIVWRRALDAFPGTPATPPKVGEETGYAASTMVAHGDRVCAIFANGDFVCCDAASGNVLWGKNLGMPDNHYGYASSLMAYENLVFVQYDNRANPRAFAMDLSDGHEVWSVARKKMSWASPACIPMPSGMQLVLNSEKDVDAYEPATGKPIWTLDCLDGEVAPSPAYGGGMVFVANDNATATAIKFAEGVTPPKPEIAWQWDEVLPDTSSPVGTDTHFYMTTARGEIACLDIATGKQAWLQELDEGFASSPIVAGDRVYVIDVKGVAHVFKTGPTFESISTSPCGEAVLATPAVMDGRIYIRTEKNLICVARQDATGS